MFKVLFTSDYEIHGSGMGSPTNLVVDPTTRMLDQFDRYGAKLTIMADTGELSKFKEYWERTGQDRFAWGAIAAQLARAVRTGHDVQLHIHSSYANAVWDEAKGYWKQDWNEYDFASLPYDRLRALIREGKALLEETCRRAVPSYECFAFRAANWSMHPSPNVVRALLAEGLRIDTSVWKYGRYDDLVKFDYTNAHDALVPWPVSDDDVCRRDPNGRLFEFPIYTEQQPIWRFLTANRVYRVIAQRLNPLPDAEPTSGASPKKSITAKVKKLVAQHAWKMDFNQCTGRQLIEGLLRVEQRYGHRDVPLPFVLIGHSKTFTRHNERSLRPFLEFVQENPDRFSWGTFRDFDPERYRALDAAA